MILKKIKKYLISKIKTSFFEIHDDSFLHSHSKNSHSKKNITHLKIIIISNDFSKKKLIDRHKLIFKFLEEITKKKIYSITLYTYTVLEWNNKKNKKIPTSKCLKNTYKKQI